MTEIRYTVDANGCWNWSGYLDKYGYGRTAKSEKYAHRASYEGSVGPIGIGLQLDHLCRNRACVNPDHLEPVTQQENIRRGRVGANHRDKTHCPAGHPYSEVNTYRTPNSKRVCRACRAQQNRAYRSRRAAA